MSSDGALGEDCSLCRKARNMKSGHSSLNLSGSEVNLAVAVGIRGSSFVLK